MPVQSGYLTAGDVDYLSGRGKHITQQLCHLTVTELGTIVSHQNYWYSMSGEYTLLL